MKDVEKLLEKILADRSDFVRKPWAYIIEKEKDGFKGTFAQYDEEKNEYSIWSDSGRDMVLMAIVQLLDFTPEELHELAEDLRSANAVKSTLKNKNKREEKKMFVKKYYHVSGVFDADKKTVYCSECGAVLDENLLSDVPCTAFVNYVCLYGEYRFDINVWNCRASLRVYREIGNNIEYCSLDFKNPEDKSKLEELVYKSVEDVGMINMSGIYPLSDELQAFLEEKLGKREIEIKNRESNAT